MREISRKKHKKNLLLKNRIFRILYSSIHILVKHGTDLSGAVGLEGPEHRGGFQEKRPNAHGGQVLVPLVQGDLNGVLQALCKPKDTRVVSPSGTP